MYALVDCNSFFASVEKVFHPGLDGKPVCVLSNNDGCIVALTKEAKAVGLKRGEPIHKCKDVVERGHVAVFSSNMMLYAAMSKRVTNILRQSVAMVENYSIDESFCNLCGYEKHHDLEAFMREIAERIMLWTDIPVSVGVAPTKTLAKVGSKFAKQYKGYRSVCMIDSEEKRRKALSIFDLSDVWGIGRRTFEKLRSMGVETPLQFADRPSGWVRSNFTKPTYQTWLELNGVPCIATEEVMQKQTICTSKSFGELISDLEMLKASVASFASSCANKLRAQRSVAASVIVFIQSNPFREDLPQYYGADIEKLFVGTADTLEITATALKIVERIYKPGIMYKKSGVIVGDISSDSLVEQDLFDSVQNRHERLELSRALDCINQRYGLKTIQMAVEGDNQQPWKVKCEHRSGNYLSSLDDLLTIQV